jgi:hypothetical protein
MSAFDQIAFNKKPKAFGLPNRGPRYNSVEICGSFDDWQVRHQMNFDPFTNQWFVTLHLKPGEELLITENSQRVAKLTGEIYPQNLPRQKGSAKGKLIVHSEDDEHLEAFQEYMP